MSIASKNLHIFITPFQHESRALKQSHSLILANVFKRVLFAVLWIDGLEEKECIDEERFIWRVKLLIPNKRFVYRFRYFEWALRIFFSKEIDDVEVIQVHSLPSLPLGVAIKILRKKKLIYDAHELETESNGLKGFRKKIYKLLEKTFIHYADCTIVVSDSIATWYYQNYKIEPHVIRNIPVFKSDSNNSNCFVDVNLKEKFNLSSNDILFIYLGGLFKGRGIEILLESFSQSNSNKHVLFMGYGELESMILSYQLKYSNIHFHSAVKPDQVLDYARMADVGLSVIENICLSYYYCLPNKVFEYMMSGLPIIVSNFPEMGKLVDDYNCGWKVEVDKDSILQLINSISWEDVKQKKVNSANARNVLSWQLEGEKFVEIYKQVLSKP
jgi:glycosyltransferase involved in cell wall biosynthesis